MAEAQAPEKSAEAPLPAEELADLKKKAGERDQYLDLAQRTRAEFENFQKRNRNERDLERKFAYTPLVRDLLPVLDNLERALNASKEAGETGSLAQGVAMVQSQFLDLLKRNGIVRIEAQGKPFDPNEHEAVMQKPSPEHAPNTVVQVLENGFMIHDRVLRPAKVIVSAKG
jgi:molecular chaperone GrpE